MKINYLRGGYFILKQVKWDQDSPMYIDYEILIEEIKDNE
jgi:hypothetical protein